MSGLILQSYVASTIDVFQKLGFDAASLTRDSKLSIAELSLQDDSSALIAVSELKNIYCKALAQSKLDNIGLQFGLNASFGIYGIVGYAMLSARTDIDAVNMALKYQPLILGSIAHISMRIEDQTGIMRVDVASQNSQFVRFYIEQLFACGVVFNNTLIGQPLRVSELRVSYSEPSYVNQYRQLFKCPITFECQHNEMHFDPQVFDIKLPNTNQAATQACASICDALLDTLEQTTTTRCRLMQILQSDFLSYSNMRVAAKHFHCDERTLRRKLELEGTSFRTVRNEVCKTMALELLGEKKTISEVSVLLGYSSPRTFRKAFNSWTGITPAQARKSLQRPIQH